MAGALSSYPAPAIASAVGARVGTKARAWLPRLVEGLAALGVGGLLLSTYTKPWWSIRLYAPQYPDGLGVQVLLSGARGDVREIDTLNHYIGMASLETAAPLERKFALAGICLAAAFVTGLLLIPKRTANAVGFGIALTVPLAFVTDFSLWLRHFGNNLDPRAPLRLDPFTPDLFGNGVIGQFMTFSRPELGFWLALAAALLALLLLALRTAKDKRLRGFP
jgi:hypothetical protein